MNTVSPQATYAGLVRSPASHYAPGAVARSPNPFDGDLPDHDFVSLVFWSLVIALMIAIPVVSIALIKLFN